MTNPIHIYKIGGSITDCPERLAAFINEFQVDDRPKILVHGGGKEATSLAKALGLQTRMIDGRRVTDAEMLRVVVMVYAGLINKRLVASLQSKGCNAIGLTAPTEISSEQFAASLSRPISASWATSRPKA